MKIKKGNELVEMLGTFATAFATMTILLSLIGYLLPLEDIHDTFMGVQGLRYATLLQIAAFCIILSLLRLLFFSDLVFKKMLRLWRMALLIVCMTGVVAIFVAVFGWFPINEWAGWLGYFGGVFTSSGIVFLVLWRKTRRQSRQYDDLLRQYKENKHE